MLVKAAFAVALTASQLEQSSPLYQFAPKLNPGSGALTSPRMQAPSQKGGSHKRKRRTSCPRCAAMALAVALDSSSLDDLDATAAPADSSGVGEVVVLRDWLEKSRKGGEVEVISSYKGEQGGGDRSPPYRFQELIQVCKLQWNTYVRSTGITIADSLSIMSSCNFCTQPPPPCPYELPSQVFMFAMPIETYVCASIPNLVPRRLFEVSRSMTAEVIFFCLRSICSSSSSSSSSGEQAAVAGR